MLLACTRISHQPGRKWTRRQSWPCSWLLPTSRQHASRGTLSSGVPYLLSDLLTSAAGTSVQGLVSLCCRWSAWTLGATTCTGWLLVLASRSIFFVFAGLDGTNLPPGFLDACMCRHVCIVQRTIPCEAGCQFAERCSAGGAACDGC